MKENYKSILILVILCLFLMICLFNSEPVLSEMLRYTNLFFQKVFPPSFLFLTISSLLIDYQLIVLIQKLFRIQSAYFYVFIFSMISGFPSGAFITRNLLLKKVIDLDEADHIIMFSHFPNPLFVLSSVPVILGNQYEVYFLFLSIVFSNFIILLIVLKKQNTPFISYQFPRSFIVCLQHHILQSFKTILMIYGISLSFNLIAFIGSSMIPFSDIGKVLFSGMFDLTRGVFSLSIISSRFFKRLFLLLFFSFGSFSIHMQTKSILSDTQVSYKYYFLGRVYGFLLSSIFYTLMLLVGNRLYY